MATALIGIRDDGTDRSDWASLKKSISSLAERNGELVDHWLTTKCIQCRRRQFVLRIIHRMQRGDSLYVENVSGLGSSISEVLGILSEALKRGINVYGVADGFAFDDKIELRSYLAALEQAVTIYNSFISNRTKAALEKKKRDGARLGRPVGSDCKMRILQQNRASIYTAMEKGIPYMDICRKYRVSFSTLHRFRKAEGLLPSSGPHSHAMSDRDVLMKESFINTK